MSNLRFIMHVDEEEQEPRVNIRDATSSSPGMSRGREPSASSDHATNPGDHHHDRLTTTAATLKRRGASGRHHKSSAAATSSSSSTSTARRAAPARGSRSTSTEEMDRGYGGHSSGSGSGGMNPNTPVRPMGNPPGGDIPLKLTPITGRVSRAKKGVPVHICDMCTPPKTFTRAEHLRRHQLSHQTPQYPCTYAGCDRAFHRADLLARHATRHEQEGDRVSSKGTDDTSRRTSTTSMDEGASKLAYLTQGSTMGGGSSSRGSRSTPSSDMPSNANYPGNNTSYQSMSNQGSGSTPMSPPQLPGHHDSYRPSSSGPSQAPGGGYVLSSASIPTITNQPPSGNSSPTTALNYGLEFQSPRTSSPFPLCLVTQGLQQTYTSLTDPDSNPPGLLPHEASPAWASSDSNFSTPSDIGHKRGMFRSYDSPTSDWPVSFIPAYHTTASHDMRSPGGGGLDVMTSGAPFFTNPFASSPQHPPYPHLMDLPMTFQGDSGFLGGGHAHHNPYSSVRSPTPPNISSSVQSAESLVTLAPSLPETQAVVSRYKDPAALVGPGATFLSAVTLHRSVRNAIPNFLEVYWKRFDTLFPLIHRRSFEIAPDDVLRCAMAAVGTQFLDGKEDRIKGNQLHEFAWQEVRRAPQWSVQNMQTILLCEYFARFRGRKAAIRPSLPFQSLYSRVANPQIPDPTFGSTTLGVPTPTTNTTTVARWTEWIDAEARRRLLAACFVLDAHTSVYYEQPLTRRFTNPCPPIPLTGASQKLWNAVTAEDWDAILTFGTQTSEPIILSEDIITPERIASAPHLDKSVLLASETLRLPKRTGPSTLDLNIAPDLSAGRRIMELFPGHPVASTYLALHYTPLQDLLAVSGDSWLFTMKILPSQSFQQHQKRLKQWTSSLHAGIAANFAAKALVAFLNDNSNTTTSAAAPHGEDAPAANESIRWNMCDISDYWAVYVCALICWALSNQAARGGAGVGTVGHVGGVGGAGNKGAPAQQRSSYTNGQPAAALEQRGTEAEALEWLHMVAGLEPADVLATVSVRGKRDIMGVVGMVKRRLDVEAAGGRSRLLVDALGVLRKLEEGVNWKWF